MTASDGEPAAGQGMTTIAPDRLAGVFVELADTLVDRFDLVEFLQMVTTRTSELTGTRAGGLLLADDDGRLRFMAASDERATVLEVFQVQAREGPCLDAYAAGAPVVNADLSVADARWPSFTRRALQLGYRSVHAFPLRLRRERIGALGLFGDAAGRMAVEDTAIVQALADVATIGLLQERAVHRGEVLTQQLQAALTSRVVIEQAKGALAQIWGVSVDEAFLALRAHCRRNHLRLGDVAAEVVADPGNVPQLTGT